MSYRENKGVEVIVGLPKLLMRVSEMRIFIGSFLVIFCFMTSEGCLALAGDDSKTDKSIEENDENSLEDLLFEPESQEKKGSTDTGDLLEEDLLWSTKGGDEKPLLDNLRWALDFSSRAVIDTGDQQWRGVHALGLDVHKVFSSESQDWGTLVAQLYLTRVDRVRRRPYFFDDAHDSELVVRIFNFNLTGLYDGRFNIRVGHFDIPYGLEYTINTNGTLRQFLTVANLGLKNDYGVTINGVLKYFVYEFALSRGTWNEFYDRNEPFIFSGRVGSGQENNFIAGLSGFYGEVAQPGPSSAKEIRDVLSQQTAPRVTLRRWRLGLDLQWYWNRLGFIGESSYGIDGSQTGPSGRGQQKWNNLLEVNWQAQPMLQTYVQYRAFLTKAPRATQIDVTSLTVGARFTPAILKIRAETNWAFSIQLTQALSTPNHRPRNLSASFQLRVRL